MHPATCSGFVDNAVFYMPIQQASLLSNSHQIAPNYKRTDAASPRSSDNCLGSTATLRGVANYWLETRYAPRVLHFFIREVLV